MNLLILPPGFEPLQALRRRLQGFFRLGNEKFENFGRDIGIVRKRSGQKRSGDMIDRALSGDLPAGGIRGIPHGRTLGRRECEGISLLECGNVAGNFRSARGNLQEIEFEKRYRVG